MVASIDRATLIAPLEQLTLKVLQQAHEGQSRQGAPGFSSCVLSGLGRPNYLAPSLSFSLARHRCWSVEHRGSAAKRDSMKTADPRKRPPSLSPRFVCCIRLFGPA
jgi:hypothetical protein